MAEQTPNILILTTSHKQLGDTERVTGIWLEELTTPYYAFVDAGATVTVASIQGGAVPIDPESQAEAAEKPPRACFKTRAKAKWKLTSAWLGSSELSSHSEWRFFDTVLVC